MPVSREQRRKRIRRFAAACVPIVVLTLMSSAAVFIGQASLQPNRDGISRFFSANCSALDATAVDPHTFKQHAGYFSYAALSELHLFVCGAVSLFVVVLLAFLRLPKRTTVALIVGAVILAAISTIVPIINPWTIANDLAGRHIVQLCSGVEALLLRQNQAEIFVATMLVVAVAVLIFFARGSAQRLALRLRQAGWLLYAGTALLVVSVLRIHSLYEWIALAEPTPQASAAVSMLGNALTRVWGTYYTLLLAAIYIPGYAIARMRAEPLLPRGLAGEATEKWLQDHGLDMTGPEVLRRALAILSPLIVGQSANVLGSLF